MRFGRSISSSRLGRADLLPLEEKIGCIQKITYCEAIGLGCNMDTCACPTPRAVDFSGPIYFGFKGGGSTAFDE